MKQIFLVIYRDSSGALEYYSYESFVEACCQQKALLIGTQKEAVFQIMTRGALAEIEYQLRNTGRSTMAEKGREATIILLPKREEK